MGWRNKSLSPEHDLPRNVRNRHPCPGLFRFAGMVGFLVVAFSLYYGGTTMFGLERLDWAAPAWTVKHIVLVAACIILGGLTALLAAAYAMTIDIRNERVNDLFIVLWQFLANGCLIWVVTIGIAMSASLGREEAKAAVLQYGAESASFIVIGTGFIVGFVSGVAYFIAPILRLPLYGYLAVSETVSLLTAHWLFHAYGIDGKSWVVAGLLIPIILLFVAPPMIERDRRIRRLAMEELS